MPRSFFGIFAESPTPDDFDAMAAAGFGTYRVPINWGRIQSTRRGGYDFSHLDHQIESIERAGLRPMPVVYGTPHFVHAAPKRAGVRPALHPPVRHADLVRWRRFNTALARRYGPHGRFARDPTRAGYRPIRSWIIWNEQNAMFYWQPHPNPRQYARLVRYAHAGLTRVNRRSEVVLGGMFGYPLASKSIEAVRYLRRLYRVRGIKRRFDAVNVHPYGPSTATAIDQIRDARRVMNHAGDRRTPIVIGEIGWSSVAVGEDGQARRHASFLRRVLARRHRWRIERAFIYVWRDVEANSCFWCPSAGLVSADGAPKPALTRISAIIAAATGRQR